MYDIYVSNILLSEKSFLYQRSWIWLIKYTMKVFSSYIIVEIFNLKKKKTSVTIHFSISVFILHHWLRRNKHCSKIKVPKVFILFYNPELNRKKILKPVPKTNYSYTNTRISFIFSPQISFSENSENFSIQPSDNP